MAVKKGERQLEAGDLHRIQFVFNVRGCCCLMGSSANWIALAVEGQIVEVGQIVSFKEGQSKSLQLEPIGSSNIRN